VSLNDELRLPYIPELIERKVHGAEQGILESREKEFHEREYERLVARVIKEAEDTHHPDEPNCRHALNDLLVRMRLNTFGL
jgi:uncharacterized protein